MKKNPLLAWQHWIDADDLGSKEDLLYFQQEFGAGFEYPTESLDPSLAREFAELRKQYEAGDHFALIHVLAVCAELGLLMPEWAAYGFWSQYRKITAYKVKGLDEAFGTYLPKGNSLNAARKRREVSLRVYLCVRKLRRSGAKVGEALFERVGKKYAVGASSARDYYYWWKDRVETRRPPET